MLCYLLRLGAAAAVADDAAAAAAACCLLLAAGGAAAAAAAAWCCAAAAWCCWLAAWRLLLAAGCRRLLLLLLLLAAACCIGLVLHPYKLFTLFHKRAVNLLPRLAITIHRLFPQDTLCLILFTSFLPVLILHYGRPSVCTVLVMLTPRSGSRHT